MASRYDLVVRNTVIDDGSGAADRDAGGVEMSVVNRVVATRQGRSTGARSGRRLRPVP